MPRLKSAEFLDLLHDRRFVVGDAEKLADDGEFPFLM